MTRGQSMVLNVMRNPPNTGHELWTARKIADILDEKDPGIRVRLWTYDRVHAILLRLESRGYVQRFLYPGNKPSEWRIV